VSSGIQPSTRYPRGSSLARELNLDIPRRVLDQLLEEQVAGRLLAQQDHAVDVLDRQLRRPVLRLRPAARVDEPPERGFNTAAATFS